ncbi:isoprenoid synthase domain-containing protein [Chiua virens]|nr:isoprenoid synthase domain-containing protein [Chiua virens]
MIAFSRCRGVAKISPRPWQRHHPTAVRRFSASVKNYSDAETSNPTEYCKELVRKHDYEGYLTSQFYPRQYQNAFYALRAFYIELSMIKEGVSQTTLGQARLMFWRDAVKDIFAVSHATSPRGTPSRLGSMTQRKGVASAPYHFQRIIEARVGLCAGLESNLSRLIIVQEQELRAQSHLTVESVTSHAESTASTFLYLLLELLNLPSATLSHAASHLGVAQSFTTLLRAFPFHASKGIMVIPAEITAKHGVNQQEVFTKGQSGKALEDAVYEFATIANDNLLTARGMFHETGEMVPVEAMPVFASAVGVGRMVFSWADDV